MKELIRKLVESYGPVGFEDEVRAIIRAEVADLADEIRVGKLGDLIAVKKGSGGGQKVMLVAHMDEIGLMVTHIDKRGYARVAPLGGVFSLYSVGARVRFAAAFIASSILWLVHSQGGRSASGGRGVHQSAGVVWSKRAVTSALSWSAGRFDSNCFSRAIS